MSSPLEPQWPVDSAYSFKLVKIISAAPEKEAENMFSRFWIAQLT